MAEQKMYQAPGVDLHHLGQSLHQWYTSNGYKAQAMDGPGGSVVVQTTKGGGLIKALGGEAALTVTLTTQGDNLFVQTGGAKWVTHAASGVVGVILFWPLAAVPAYGAFQQKGLIDETYQFIERYLASGGQVPVMAPMAAPMMGAGMAPAPAPAPAGGTHCPACGQSVHTGAKFCEKCGASLAAPGCPKCGAKLSPGAKFCASCGEKV